MQAVIAEGGLFPPSFRSRQQMFRHQGFSQIDPQTLKNSFE